MSSITPADWSYTEYARLASSAKSDSEGLQEAAKQFESLFINMWLKSAREANAALSKDSPFSSNEMEMQQQMFDSQMAMHLAKEGGVGLAPTIMRQLSGGLSDPPAPEQRDVAMSSKPVLDDSAAQRVLDQAQNTAPVTNKSMATRTSLFENPQDFVNTIGPRVKRVASGAGLPALTVMAQAALETGWGKSVITDASGEPSHNLFGIKDGDWSGPTMEIHSKEFLLGQWQDKQANFRAYPDWDAGISDYAQTISQSDRYSEATASTMDASQYADFLQDAGYATDPSYAKKLKDVMQRLAGFGF